MGKEGASCGALQWGLQSKFHENQQSHSKVEKEDTQATGYSQKPTCFPLQEGKCAKN